jgi:hypothetical protein
MTQIKIFTDNNGRITSSSRAQLHSFFKSVGGPFGTALAAAHLPKIERELRTCAKTSQLASINDPLMTRLGGTKIAPRFMSLRDYIPTKSDVNSKSKIL